MNTAQQGQGRPLTLTQQIQQDWLDSIEMAEDMDAEAQEFLADVTELVQGGECLTVAR